jgi:hypothetical protein
MAGLHLLLAGSLPGGPLVKDLCFGLLGWFFRVAMGATGQWVAFEIPAATLTYTLIAGLLEMLALGALYGVALR